MPVLRLAYSTLFLIALIAFFVAWSQVGGQSHIDLLPWWIKLVLGMSIAFTVVRAAASAVAGERAWNGQTLRWLGLTIALGIVCGLATYYAHTYLEESDEPDSETDSAISELVERPAIALPSLVVSAPGGPRIREHRQHRRCPSKCAIPVSASDRSPRR
jgi:hypothetical protein